MRWPDEAVKRTRLPSAERALATANFQMGVYLNEHGRKPDAQKFLDEASRLWPEAWTFRRQTSNLLPPEVPAAQRNKLAMKASGVTFFLEDMDMAGMP